MPKSFKIILVYICLNIVLLSGCSNKQKVENADFSTFSSYSTTEKEALLPSAASIQNLTEDSINERYEKANSISYEDYTNIDNMSYLAFSYKNHQSLYYGFTVARQQKDEWELAYFEDYPNEQDESVKITQFIGSYPDTEDQKFHVTSGYVNNEQIKQVILYYPESKVITINLGENQHGFVDININSDYSLTKIECKSDDGKTIYQKDYDKK